MSCRPMWPRLLYIWYCVLAVSGGLCTNEIDLVKAGGIDCNPGQCQAVVHIVFNTRERPRTRGAKQEKLLRDIVNIVGTVPSNGYKIPMVSLPSHADSMFVVQKELPS
jgi:hypothetical protein